MNLDLRRADRPIAYIKVSAFQESLRPRLQNEVVLTSMLGPSRQDRLKVVGTVRGKSIAGPLDAILRPCIHQSHTSAGLDVAGHLEVHEPVIHIVAVVFPFDREIGLGLRPLRVRFLCR